MFTIVDAGTNPLYDNHPVYEVYREDGSYWGTTRCTSLEILVDGLAQEMGGRYIAPERRSRCLGCGRPVSPMRFRCDRCEPAEEVA